MFEREEINRLTAVYVEMIQVERIHGMFAAILYYFFKKNLKNMIKISDYFNK